MQEADRDRAAGSANARPLKRDGTPDLRFRPRPTARVLAPATTFTAVDRVIAERHVRDLEAAGARCSILDDRDGRPEAWMIALRSGETATIYRAGRRIFNDVVDQDGVALPDCLGHTSIDIEFRAVRLMAGIRDVSYATLGLGAAEALTGLPEWLLA